MTVPRIGLTLGDPGGVGAEVAFKAMASASSLPGAEYVLFGNARLVAEEARALSLPADFKPWPGGGTAGRPGVFLRDVAAPAADRTRHRPDAANGEASFRFFEAAVAAARGGFLDAIVTAPVSKAAWGLAGLAWRGHTEFLEGLFPGAIMSFWSPRLRVALLTHHLPLAEALGRVRRESLLGFFRALHRSLAGLEGGPREILVPGLNPHAGEGGWLGRQEEAEIRPAIEAARAEGIEVSGPYPPDTVFRRALDRPEIMVAALYHDQGLIPFKLEGFENGVNATLGLPFVRTSPDHGTAFDIAGTGGADPQSMVAAVRLAARFSASAS
jgi:4-hydroxythreonine-4-phosphate dehydrogenase